MRHRNAKIGLLGVLRLPKVNPFEENLRNGQKWELPLLEKISRLRLKEQISCLTNSGEFQRKGIDGILYAEKVKIDLKSRKFDAYHWNDILIETVSIIERNKLGWFYTSEADVIPYVWENSSRTNLIDGYFLFIQNKSFREWFETYKATHSYWPHKRVAHSNNNGEHWSTENYAVPILAFPTGSILRFDPHLPESGKQSTLLQVCGKP